MSSSHYTSKMSKALQLAVTDANNSGNSEALAVADHVDQIHALAIDEQEDPNLRVGGAMQELIEWAQQFQKASEVEL